DRGRPSAAACRQTTAEVSATISNRGPEIVAARRSGPDETQQDDDRRRVADEAMDSTAVVIDEVKDDQDRQRPVQQPDERIPDPQAQPLTSALTTSSVLVSK